MKNDYSATLEGGDDEKRDDMMILTRMCVRHIRKRKQDYMIRALGMACPCIGRREEWNGTK